MSVIVVSAALELFDYFWRVTLFALETVLQIEYSQVADSLIIVHNKEEFVSKSELYA